MKICYLEQSGNLPSIITEAKRKACENLGWHYERLNWNLELAEADNIATLFSSHLTWSEGRSLLYERVQAMDFDYLFFSDDDICFRPRFLPQLLRLMTLRIKLFLRIIDQNSIIYEITLTAFKQIEVALMHDRPITACIYSPNDWAHSWSKFQILHRLKTYSFVTACHDLQTHIFHNSVAKLAFPAFVSGSEGSMWYVQFAGYKLWPKRQVCITSAIAYNAVSLPHRDRESKYYNSISSIHQKIKKIVRDSEWNDWSPEFPRTTAKVVQKRLFYRYLFKRKINCDFSDVEQAWNSLFNKLESSKLRESLRKHLY